MHTQAVKFSLAMGERMSGIASLAYSIIFGSLRADHGCRNFQLIVGVAQRSSARGD
ncbi:hypothetical protein PHYBLDRAFT_142628 [Phycomyces blakesleeanus NRRL 1555(-)]|uniref:Uncharacterized protein n=1 Tax=Phycomyces blakesleeanus (strain ATCC 8743b / DSM 1359 / FGSC 10004 / NBRC 33097 / NRRL 1555) TaxID=763407 RepID=A0A162XXJ4_PHYB8|nr:hypothetical protein PHYBLDRAFT_142628 [Phycomyces blakesleeanus NRRL 1555(-)]OAD77115.1 hypothetical protein PHYBLDRAFT_142628 [Phycomyces blakesleeanus NRRL 1555(-)]|eukprot:XP_018295155.1 hypothetical protein PHYBLDRAFT_142628 [Phycomyces blakesleeanus NRRL 1555(-)]